MVELGLAHPRLQYPADGIENGTDRPRCRCGQDRCLRNNVEASGKCSLLSAVPPRNRNWSFEKGSLNSSIMARLMMRSCSTCRCIDPRNGLTPRGDVKAWGSFIDLGQAADDDIPARIALNGLFRGFLARSAGFELDPGQRLWIFPNSMSKRGGGVRIFEVIEQIADALNDGALEGTRKLRQADQARIFAPRSERTVAMLWIVPAAWA